LCKKAKKPGISQAFLKIHLDFFKLIFANATIWANPVIGQVFKGGSGRDILGWISQFRVINVTTCDAFVFVHESPSKQA
jgi:hypothetical protein